MDDSEYEMVKIEDFDRLQRQLREATTALEALDGELCTVSFNPWEPASIEAAIQQVEALIDERVGGYAENPIVSTLVVKMKDRYRDAIMEKASDERLSKEKPE